MNTGLIKTMAWLLLLAAGVVQAEELAAPAAVVENAVVAQAASSSANCPSALAFGAATQPVLPEEAGCGYNSTSCTGGIGSRHAGVNYTGTGNAVAIANGRVVKVEAPNPNGLGNTVIIKHTLPGPDCSVIYSTYSRLDSIAIAVGDAVKKGDTLGAIGQSGLHLEMKAAAMAGNPLGTGNQTQTCATDPLNARADSCFAFVGRASAVSPTPDDLGYLNPVA